MEKAILLGLNFRKIFLGIENQVKMLNLQF